MVGQSRPDFLAPRENEGTCEFFESLQIKGNESEEKSGGPVTLQFLDTSRVLCRLFLLL